MILYIQGVNMKCLNCGMKMSKKGVCVHCGYMKNGVIIDTKKKQRATLLEFYFGTKFDRYIRNENFLESGIFGPIYIMANNNFFVGLLLCIIDTVIILFFFLFNHAVIFSLMVTFLNICFLFLDRVVWATIGNMIYLRLLLRKLEKIKKDNPDNYIDIIEDKYKKDHTLVGFKYVVLGIIYFVLFQFLKTYLYYKLGLL